MNAPHLLVVDDDDRLRALLGKYLRGQGFAVSLAADAKAARALLKLFIFDLLVLDVMMPGESGLSLAAELHKRADAPPMLMLSARTAADDRVAGLEAGVDDYLPKPFEPKELSLRIRAILRRATPPAPAASQISFGNYRFDPATMELTHKGKSVRLTASEAALLACLAGRTGEPVSRETLAAKLPTAAQAGRGVDVQIARLRAKIPPPAGKPPYVRTVRGAGYVLYGSRP